MRAARLRAAGLRSGGIAHYFRAVPDLATSTGPIDVISQVESFADVGGAVSAFAAETDRENHISGATRLSTGTVGDEANAVLLTATAEQGTAVAQTLLSWRVANLVSVLVVRERLAGSPLADALTLARPQLATEGSRPAATALPSAAG